MSDGGPLRNLNLNLVAHLDALLTYRSVSRAAAHLELSQPTVSSALQRLRRHFDDELVVRHGAATELTPLALELQPLTTEALASAERVFARTSRFDPGSSTREFSLVCADYWEASVGSALAAILAADAPHVRLRFHRLTPDVIEQPAEALRTVDGILAPHGVVHGVCHEDLVTTRWSCVVDPANERVGDEPTAADLAELPWVVVGGPGPAGMPAVETLAVRQLRQAGLEPRVEVVVESFLSAPWFVRGTDRVALVHRRLAERALDGSVRVVACPVEVGSMTLALWWHPQFDGDAGHRWLREQVAAAASKAEA